MLPQSQASLQDSLDPRAISENNYSISKKHIHKCQQYDNESKMIDDGKVQTETKVSELVRIIALVII